MYILCTFSASEKFHDTGDIYLHFANMEIEALRNYMVGPNR